MKIVLYRTNNAKGFNAEDKTFETVNEPKTSHIEEGNVFVISPTNKAKTKNATVYVGTLKGVHDTSAHSRLYKLKGVKTYENFKAVLVDYPELEGVGGKIRTFTREEVEVAEAA